MADEKTFTQAEVDALIAEQISGLKTNRDDALKELKVAKGKLANYDGVDPEEFKRLKQIVTDAETKKAAAEGDFKALEKQLVERHQSELGTKDKRIGKLQSALERRLRQDELRKALTGKADPSMIELLVEHGAKYVAVRETDDDFEHFITDGKGNQQFSDGQATPMTVDALVDQTLKTKFPGAFLGTGSSGGGASKSAGGASGAVRQIATTNSPDFLSNLADIASGKVNVG